MHTLPTAPFLATQRIDLPSLPHSCALSRLLPPFPTAQRLPSPIRICSATHLGPCIARFPGLLLPSSLLRSIHWFLRPSPVQVWSFSGRMRVSLQSEGLVRYLLDATRSITMVLRDSLG